MNTSKKDVFPLNLKRNFYNNYVIICIWMKWLFAYELRDYWHKKYVIIRIWTT